MNICEEALNSWNLTVNSREVTCFNHQKGGGCPPGSCSKQHLNFGTCKQREKAPLWIPIYTWYPNQKESWITTTLLIHDMYLYIYIYIHVHMYLYMMQVSLSFCWDPQKGYIDQPPAHRTWQSPSHHHVPRKRLGLQVYRQALLHRDKVRGDSLLEIHGDPRYFPRKLRSMNRTWGSNFQDGNWMGRTPLFPSWKWWFDPRGYSRTWMGSGTVVWWLGGSAVPSKRQWAWIHIIGDVFFTVCKLEHINLLTKFGKSQCVLSSISTEPVSMAMLHNQRCQWYDFHHPRWMIVSTQVPETPLFWAHIFKELWLS